MTAEKYGESSPPLGLPPTPYPEGNPQTPEKIALGKKLFNETRFSTTGEVSCATCHDADKAFTDSPLSVSEGIDKLTGTRNAPTVINSAYFETAFWDGRSPDLEDQALHPFTNPVEMGRTLMRTALRSKIKGEKIEKNIWLNVGIVDLENVHLI